VYEFFTIKYDIIVYTNAQYYNVMCAAAEYVGKARGRDRFWLAPMWFARAVTPGSTNGDARICEKRFLDRFLQFFFFFLFHLFVFFSNIFISRPRHPTAYHIIPRYYSIIPRTPFSRSGSNTASLCRIRPIPNPLSFGNRCDSAAVAAVAPGISARTVVSRSKSALGPYDATRF
jgi:hypothetical protein